MKDSLGLIGKKFGKCVIEKPLAKGGFGYSYLGYDAEFDRRRVIKVARIPMGADGDEELVLDNFKREGIVLSRLNHPQIVKIMEQGEEYSYRYMIIEYISGFDLKQVIKILTK
ncbi:protein kinase, partial [Fibrobacterota bacterium]